MAAQRMRFEPGDGEGARPTIDELVERFQHWCRANNASADAWDLDLLLDWKVSWSDGRLDDWSVSHVEEFLLDWCPRKLSAPADQALQMADSIATAFTFLGEAGLLAAGSDPGETLARHARFLGPEFEVQMANPANFGMAKSVFSGLDLDQFNQDGLAAAMADFNALPLEQRQALTDRFVEAERAAPAPQIGPLAVPHEEQVRESAERAPVLAGFGRLAEYFVRPGRPLPANGNIRLADAQALAGILGTEWVAQTPDGHKMRRHTTGGMPALDHWLWWAREVGALRVNKGRLVGVLAWQKRRAADPVGEARKAFRTLIDNGLTESYSEYGWATDELCDLMLAPLLTMMLASDDPVEFQDFTEAVERVRDSPGISMFLDPSAFEGDAVSRSLDRMLGLLERAGVVVQHKIVREHGTYTEQRVGGSAQLTPFGVVMAIEAVRESGFAVQTVDTPADLSAADLAELAAQEEVSPKHWSQWVSDWLIAQADRPSAVRELLDATCATAAAGLAMAGLDVAPEVRDDVSAAYREAVDTLPRDDPRSAAGFAWLVWQQLLDGVGGDSDSSVMSHLTLLGMLAEASPEEVHALMGPEETALVMVADAGRLAPANVECFLAVVGQHHPDKAVAKSARRELLRVRSRRANQHRS